MEGEEGISTSVRCVTDTINQKVMCNCMAVEEGISTSEGHYVRCVIVWLGKRGYQPVKD